MAYLNPLSGMVRIPVTIVCFLLSETSICKQSVHLTWSEFGLKPDFLTVGGSLLRDMLQCELGFLTLKWQMGHPTVFWTEQTCARQQVHEVCQGNDDW